MVNISMCNVMDKSDATPHITHSNFNESACLLNMTVITAIELLWKATKRRKKSLKEYTCSMFKRYAHRCVSRFSSLNQNRSDTLNFNFKIIILFVERQILCNINPNAATQIQWIWKMHARLETISVEFMHRFINEIGMKQGPNEFSKINEGNTWMAAKWKFPNDCFNSSWNATW